MDLFRSKAKSGVSLPALAAKSELPDFHPATAVRDWGSAGVFDLMSAKTGIAVYGATGSGKSSGPAKHTVMGLLALPGRVGFLLLTVKPEEAAQWRDWIAQAGRSDDIIEVNEVGAQRYNFLAEEAARKSVGGGLTLSLTTILTEVASALSKGSGGTEDGGGDKFWVDALNHLLANLIDLCILSKQPLTMLRLRELADSAPLSAEQANSEAFRKNSECCKAVMEAVRLAQNDSIKLVNVKEVASYFMLSWPNLSDKTRSIIQLQLSMLIRPFLTHPLYKIFSTDTTFRPEDAIDKGHIIICNLPVQIYKTSGIFAGILLKYLTQIAILRRSEPNDGTYLRPCVIYSDEAVNFISDYDYLFAAVSRSAGGILMYIFQNIDSLIAKLGNEHKVKSLLANLQCCFFCQNFGGTNDYAAHILGERWVAKISTTVNTNSPDERGNRSTSGGASSSHEKRHYVEAAEFVTLAKGGYKHNFQVQCICYNGGQLFSNPSGGGELLPYALLTFNQRA